MLASILPRLRLDQFSLGGLGNCATPGSTPCCSSPCKVCVTACVGVHVAGLTVVVKSGSTTVFTGSTDSTGCVVLTGVGSGSYTIEVWNGGTMMFSGPRSCPGTISINIGNPPDGTYCCGPCPIPETLYLTDNAGTTTLTGDGSGTWTGSHFLSIGGQTTTGVCPPAFPVTCMCVGGTISLNIRYTVTCQPGGMLLVSRLWNVMLCVVGGDCAFGDWNAPCNCATYNPFVGCGSAAGIAFTDAGSSMTAAWSQCAPFMWSGTPVFNPTDDPLCTNCSTGSPGDPAGPITITA
jgi:hypothetical protein